MTKMCKKTRIKVQFIKELYDKGKTKDEIMDNFRTYFNIHHDRTFYDCWAYFLNGTNSRTQRGNVAIVKSTKGIINKPDSCYFKDSSGKLVAHHISYIPELIVYLSESNHKKLHKIIDIYHKQTLLKDEEIKILRNKMKKMGMILQGKKF